MAEELIQVGIIGAGYAGMAAATYLAQRGIAVTVFEAGKVLGGRARGIDYRGMRLDNGQHILLGAYRATLKLQARCNQPGLIRRLPLALSVPGQFRLRTPALPAPLHLLWGLMTAQGLPLGERLGAIRFALRLRLMKFRLKQDVSVAQLLLQHQQDGDIGRLLWEPLCLAALNTPISRASAQVFLNVLRDSFSHARSDSDLLLPCVDLSALLPDQAAALIGDKGGVIKTGCRINSIIPHDRGFNLQWAEGSQDFSHVICATAPQHALALISGLALLSTESALIRQFAYQPIATVYLQYPAHIRLPEPMLALNEGVAQWVFDRGQTHGSKGLMAVVISAEGAWQEMDAADLGARIATELKQVFDLPDPLWHKAIVEKRATFACTVGLKRPDQKTRLKNFYLAGDYTRGDYPATIEGAVRSGICCAEMICGISS